MVEMFPSRLQEQEQWNGLAADRNGLNGTGLTGTGLTGTGLTGTGLTSIASIRIRLLPAGFEPEFCFPVWTKSHFQTACRLLEQKTGSWGTVPGIVVVVGTLKPACGKSPTNGSGCPFALVCPLVAICRLN